MGACHTTEKVHSSANRRASKKQSTLVSSPSSEKYDVKKSKEHTQLDLSGETLPNADFYASNLNIAPSLVIFFGTFYKKRLTILQNSDTIISNPSKRESFVQKLALLNGIDITVAQIWVNAYIDFMILSAWFYFAVEEKEMYTPFAIQQTQRLHLSYPSDYKTFCCLITEGKNVIHYSPRKTICNNQNIDFLENSYDEVRESIMIYLYESKQIYSLDSQETEQIKEQVWEPFYDTFIKNEYSFLLNNKVSKSTIKKAISKISTSNHNFSLANEGPSLLRNSLNLPFSFQDTANTNVLPTLDSETASEDEKNIARIVDEIKFPIGFFHLLSWEQVISISEAQEWMLEYKKFIFMSLLGKPVDDNVSENIRQVWLLHMSFTRNYQKFFVEHIKKNNLIMRWSFEETVSTINQACVNFYNDIVKKQEELLNIKLANALSEE